MFRIHDILGWIRIRILGSMLLTNGSGSAIFVIDLQDASKKLIFDTIFSAYYFLKVNLHPFSTIKSQKESQNRRNQGFSYYFCVMIEGSGSRAGSGSIPGSGSRRPKNMWIRIRNTAVLAVKIFILTIFYVYVCQLKPIDAIYDHTPSHHPAQMSLTCTQVPGLLSNPLSGSYMFLLSASRIRIH